MYDRMEEIKTHKPKFVEVCVCFFLFNMIFHSSQTSSDNDLENKREEKNTVKIKQSGCNGNITRNANHYKCVSFITDSSCINQWPG